jgi:hypothetical protein
MTGPPEGSVRVVEPLTAVPAGPRALDAQGVRVRTVTAPSGATVVTARPAEVPTGTAPSGATVRPEVPTGTAPSGATVVTALPVVPTVTVPGAVTVLAAGRDPAAGRVVRAVRGPRLARREAVLRDVRPVPDTSVVRAEARPATVARAMPVVSAPVRRAEPRDQGRRVTTPPAALNPAAGPERIPVVVATGALIRGALIRGVLVVRIPVVLIPAVLIPAVPTGAEAPGTTARGAQRARGRRGPGVPRGRRMGRAVAGSRGTAIRSSAGSSGCRGRTSRNAIPSSRRA